MSLNEVEIRAETAWTVSGYCVLDACGNAFEVVFEACPLNADALHEFASVAWGSGRKQTAFNCDEKSREIRDRYDALTRQASLLS